MADGQQDEIQKTIKEMVDAGLNDDEQVEVLKRMDAAGMFTKAGVPGTMGTGFKKLPTKDPYLIQPELPSARSQALEQGKRGGVPEPPKPPQTPAPPPEEDLTKMEPSPFGGAPMTAEQSKFVSEKLPGALKTMNKLKWEGLGAFGGGEVGTAYKFGRLGRAALLGGGTAAGSITGDVTSGEKPDVKKALIHGGVSAVTGYGIDLGADLVGKFIKPFITKAPLPASEQILASQVSKKADDLVRLADAEEGLRASVVAAPKAIREQVIKKAYAGLDGTIDLVPIGETAEAASGKMLAHGTPPSMAKVIKITRAIKDAEGEVMDMLQSDNADKEELEGAARTLVQLEKQAKVPIADAIQLRSALGRVLATARRSHAPGEAQLVPGEVYQAVKTVKTELDNRIEALAAAQGKAGHLKMADKIYSTFMGDFYNAGAPLRGATNLKPEMTGKTLDTLLKPENVNRAVAALNRWGMKEQAAALQKIADMPDRAEAVKGMKDLLVSPSSYKTRATGALREAEAKRVSDATEALRKARRDRLLIAGGTLGIGAEIGSLYRWAFPTASRGRRAQ